MENNQNQEKAVKKGGAKVFLLIFTILMLLGSVLAIVGNVATALKAYKYKDGLYENYFGTIVGCVIGIVLFLIVVIIAIVKLTKLGKLDSDEKRMKSAANLVLLSTIFSGLYFIEKYVLNKNCGIHSVNTQKLLIVAIIAIVLIIILSFMFNPKHMMKRQAFKAAIVFGLFNIVFGVIYTILLCKPIDPMMDVGPDSGSMTIVGNIVNAIAGIVLVISCVKFKLTKEDKAQLAEIREARNKENATSTKDIAKAPETKQFGDVAKADLSSVPEEYRDLLKRDFTPAIQMNLVQDSKLIDQALDAYGPEVKAIAFQEFSEYTQLTLALNKKYNQKGLCVFNMAIVRMGLSPLVRKIFRCEPMDFSKNNKEPVSGIYKKEYSKEQMAAAINRGEERNHYVTTLCNLLLDGMGGFDNNIDVDKLNAVIAKYGTTEEVDILLGIDRGHDVVLEPIEGAPAPEIKKPSEPQSEEDLLGKTTYPATSYNFPNDTQINNFFAQLGEGPLKDRLYGEYSEFVQTFTTVIAPFGELTAINKINCYICLKGMSPALRQLLSIKSLDISNADKRPITGKGEQMSQEEMVKLVTGSSKEESHYHDIEINYVTFELSKPEYEGLDDIAKYNKFIEKYGLSEYITKILGFVRG